MKWPPDDRPLTGSMVTLEPLDSRHENGLRQASAETEIWSWIDRTVPEGKAQFHRWLSERLEAKEAGTEWGYTTCFERGRILGSSSFLHPRPEHDGLEIGWTWLNPSAWRTGANVDAKLLMLTEAFENLGCMRVEFKTDARNKRSRNALSALPANFDGIFRKHMLVPGAGVRDSAFFSIVDDDWPQVKRNLERRVAGARVAADA
jgi:RimJ/RimL family protein N-acetyltransferase